MIRRAGRGAAAMDMAALRTSRLPAAVIVHHHTAPGTWTAGRDGAHGDCDTRRMVVECQGRKEFWLRETHSPGMLAIVEPGRMSYYH